MAQPQHDPAEHAPWWPIRMLIGAIIGIALGGFLFFVVHEDSLADTNGKGTTVVYRWEHEPVFPQAYWWLGIGGAAGTIGGLLVTKRYQGCSCD